MKRSRTPGIARIVVLVGGTCAEMARYLKSLSADIVLWVDVLAELEKVKTAPGVIKVVLAAGKTLASLFEGLPDNAHGKQVREFLKSLPGVDLNTGLAQLPLAGIRAAELLVATPQFQAVLLDIYSKVKIIHNGTVEAVELDVWSSGCGGTGGPGGGPLAKKIAQYYREQHHAVVHIRYNRAGSLSFEGLGEAIHRNLAATLLSDLVFTLLEDRPLAEVRSLNLFELPMVVKDKASRDHSMASLVQALNCSEFRQLRDLAAPNTAAHSHLGSIALLDVAWWHELSAERIQLNVAARFREELLQILRTEPARNVLERIEVESLPLTPVSEATIPQLVDRLRQNKRTEPAGLLDAVENITLQFLSVAVYAHSRTSGRGVFEDCWREHCRIPCRTTREFRGRLALLRGLVEAVEAEMLTRSAEIARLQKNRRQNKATLSAVKDEYYPRAVTDKVANWIFADSRRRDRDQRFGALAKTARETKLAVDKLETENKALGLCRDEIQREVQETERRVRSVLNVLGDDSTLTSAAQNADLVEIADLDGVLQDLLQIADLPEIDHQLLAETLLGCAKHATLAGLAAITGGNKSWVNEPRVDLIARQLIQQAPTIGPYWGGERPMSVDATVFVLPPVSPTLRAELLAAYAPLVHHADDFQLVFADTAEAGFNVVRLQIRHPKTYREIVTPPIKGQADEIVNHPERYFPEGFDIDQIQPFLSDFNYRNAVPIMSH